MDGNKDNGKNKIVARVMYSNSLDDVEAWRGMLRCRKIDEVYFDVSQIPLEQIPELSQKLRDSVSGIPVLFEPFVLGPTLYPSESLTEAVDAPSRIVSTPETFEQYTDRRMNIDRETKIAARVMYSNSLDDAKEWRRRLGRHQIDDVYFDVSKIPLEQIPELSQKLQASIRGIPNLFEPFVLGPVPYPSESLIEAMEVHFVDSTPSTFEDYTRRRAKAWKR